MRRIDPSKFSVATRGTSREINRSIVLNLVRTLQPISRADLARQMGVRRGAISLIVNDLLQDSALAQSGGQKQRQCNARALATTPEKIIFQETTSEHEPIANANI